MVGTPSSVSELIETLVTAVPSVLLRLNVTVTVLFCTVTVGVQICIGQTVTAALFWYDARAPVFSD